mgnify:CR=1 FL=1
MVYMVTKTPEQAPDAPEYVTIDFEKGIPVAVNGEKHDAVTLITVLNEIGARNGVGIVDIVENRLVGMKSRGIYENPAVPSSCMLTENWNTSASTAIPSTIKKRQPTSLPNSSMMVNGSRRFAKLFRLSSMKRSRPLPVRLFLKLYKGNIISAGSTSPYSLYNEEFVTFGEDDVYDQTDAEGFINLFGLPLKMRALMKQHVEKQGK